MSLDDAHPDFEDLSAFHDGEAPEWAAHLGGCAACRARVARIAELSERVAGPPLDDANASDHDAVSRAVAEASLSGTQSGAPTTGPSASSAPPLDEPRRWWMGASVAALLLFCVGAGALVASRADHRPTPTAVGSGSFADSPEGGAARVTEPVIVAGDLGEIPDRGALVARVRADLAAARAAVTGEDQAAVSPEASPAPPARAAAQADAEVPQTTLAGPERPPERGDGPQPCEAEARRNPGVRGAVIYQAMAEKDGTAAVVLAFGPPPGSEAITVEVRARSDCRLLLQGAIL